jgi:hypothetical protein
MTERPNFSVIEAAESIVDDANENVLCLIISMWDQTSRRAETSDRQRDKDALDFWSQAYISELAWQATSEPDLEEEFVSNQAWLDYEARKKEEQKPFRKSSLRGRNRLDDGQYEL